MSTDFTALAVALVGVAGTMGAPWLTQRARHAESRDQAEREVRAREASWRDQLFEEKRALYAALNSVTRAYRSALRDCASMVPPSGSAEALELARTAYREQFAQAEMVLPQRPFEVAVVTNEHLGYSYKLILNLYAADPVQAVDEVLTLVRGPVAEAVELLRLALREDLGVIERVDDLGAQLAALPIHPRNRRTSQPDGTPPTGRPAPDRRADGELTATETATDQGEQAA